MVVEPGPVHPDLDLEIGSSLDRLQAVDKNCFIFPVLKREKNIREPLITLQPGGIRGESRLI